MKLILVKRMIKKGVLKNKYIKLMWWFIKRQPLPTVDGKYLHLGCGTIDYPDFINIDIYPYHHIHFIRDVQNLKIFKDNSIDLIYISHCLEHFSFIRLPNILEEYFRVLKPSGILRISVPDFEKILAIYHKENTIQSIEAGLMGGQEYKYNFHYSVFNQNFLEKLLKDAGFSKTQNWQFGDGRFKDLPDWSGKKVEVSESGKTYEISLNIEAIK